MSGFIRYFLITFVLTFVTTTALFLGATSYLEANPTVGNHVGVYYNNGVSYVRNYSCTIDMPAEGSLELYRSRFDWCIKQHRAK